MAVTVREVQKIGKPRVPLPFSLFFLTGEPQRSVGRMCADQEVK